MRDDRPHPHQGTAAYGAVLPDQRAGTDIGARADPDAAAETGAGGHGGEVTNGVVMSERHVRHDRHVRSDADAGGQDRLSEDHGSGANL